MSWFRKLYKWVLHWADHPAGSFALFFLALAESSFFPIPPDVLLIALSFGRPKKAYFYAFISSLGSVIGGVIGYGIGLGFWSVIKPYFLGVLVSESAFETVAKMYQENVFWSVFTAGFTPIPYKVFTIAAGVFEVSFWTFFVASLFSRSMRFFAVALVIYFGGDKAKAILERHFEKATILFVILLVGGFFVMKWVF